MDNFDFLNDIDPAELSLEAILAEYKSLESVESPDEAAAPVKEQGALRIETVGDGGIIKQAELSGGASGTRPRPARMKKAPAPKAAPVSGPVPRPAPVPEPAPARVSSREIYREQSSGAAYASADHPRMTDRQREYLERDRPKKPGLGSLAIGIAALLAMRRRDKPDSGVKSSPSMEDEAEPEVSYKTAAKIYGTQIGPFKFRGAIAVFLSLIMLYISFASGYSLPLPGMMAGNITVTTVICLIILLAVMIAGLDVITSGAVSLARRRPGAESLVTVSCLSSIINALYVIISKNTSLGLPYCAISAVSVTCAIYASRLYCEGFRTTFRTASQSSQPYTVTAERGLAERGVYAMKSRAPSRGFVRNAEQPDLAENVWSLLAPVFVVACLVLATLASVARGRASDFFFAYSAMCTACSSFSALLTFPLLFSVAAKRLFSNGAAIAGWFGAAELGGSRSVVITDSDIFPGGTLSVSGVRVLEGVSTGKVISYAGSVMAASGAALGAAFTELMRKQGCTMQRVDEFACHEGGGLTAVVRSEPVYAGTSSFMRLLGVRLPQSQLVRDAVYVAIGGALVGVFTVDYIPVVSVQDALLSLLQRRSAPLFATRDFNITPAMIRQKFHVPADGSEFLTYADRYRISSTEPSPASAPCAVLAREGLGPLAAAYSCGKRLYRATQLCVLLSALGSAVGLVIMFFLCFSASYESAGASNAIMFMLLWLVPVLVISYGLRR